MWNMFAAFLRMYFVKLIKWLFALLYILVVFSFTLFGRTAQAEPIFKGLFWELQSGMWFDIGLNILLFVPLGLIIGGWKGLIICFALSGLIETIQYIYQIGYCELDDILNNTIGAGIGILLKGLCERHIFRKWEDLPEFIKTTEVRPYWEILDKKRDQLVLKRFFDILLSIILLVFLTMPMIVIAILIKMDSDGPVFYRQERVTMYGKHFRIHKFRTMVNNADKIGSTVTIGNDSRITKVGNKLRNLRLDELPQLFDVLTGDSGIIGTTKKNLDFTGVSLA